MKLISKIPIEIVFPILLAWQILLTFQSLDLADTGFHLTAFRFIFDDPYSVQYSMMFWLSDACGALWMRLWPDGGLYWFRLGWVIVISGTFFIYYSLLRPIFGNRNAIIGLAITLVFILQGGPECLNYDIFTTLGYALGILFLFHGLLRNRLRLIFLSGFIFGMSIFFKLSNITAMAFFILIPFFNILNNEKFREFLKKGCLWLVGLLFGMLLILFLIWQFGQLGLFMDNLSVVSAMGGDDRSSHGLRPMLLSYLSGYLNSFVMLVIFVLFVWAYSKLSNKFKSLFSEKNQLIMLLLVGGMAVASTIFLNDVFWSKVRYLFIALMIFQVIVRVADKKNGNEIRLLSLAGLVLLLIAPLGSDSGLDKSAWGMWILGPMVLVFPINWEQVTPFRFSITNNQGQFLKRLVAVVVLPVAIIYAWQNTYFDDGPRIKKIYSIGHPQMRYIYTSQKRATVVNELIREAFPKIENEKYLLAFIEIPMLNYLGDKKPFISTSWPKLYYNPQTFRQKLEEALQQRKAFPAIIRQKQNTMMADWPVKPDPGYFEYPTGLSKWPEHGKILNEFITQNSYQVVWENEMFQLLIKKTGVGNESY